MTAIQLTYVFPRIFKNTPAFLPHRAGGKNSPHCAAVIRRKLFISDADPYPRQRTVSFCVFIVSPITSILHKRQVLLCTCIAGTAASILRQRSESRSRTDPQPFLSTTRVQKSSIFFLYSSKSSGCAFGTSYLIAMIFSKIASRFRTDIGCPAAISSFERL